jgi:hypothetical protein
MAEPIITGKVVLADGERMRWLLSRLYRERRRFTLVAFLTFLGGWLAFRSSPLTIFGLPLEIAAGFAFMFGVTAALVVIVLVFPQVRSNAESVALGIPVLSLMGSFDPEITSAGSSLVFVFGLLFMYLATVLYGSRWLDALAQRSNGIYQSAAKSGLSPEKLWPYICVTPDSPPEFRSESTISLKWVDPGKSFCDVARFGDTATVEELQTIVAIEPYALFQFHFQTVHNSDNFGHRGMVTQRLTKTETGSLLESVRVFDRDSWRAFLFSWIDDAWGRLDDQKIRSFETKEKATSKVPAPHA